MNKPLNEIRIFIVEDSFTWSFMLETVLQDNGNFRISTFKDGYSCLDDLGNNPDVVILDHMLEGAINGLETFKEINKVKPKTPVIIVSGQEDTKVAEDFLRLGAFDYIQKDKEKAISRLVDSVSRALNLEF